MAVGIWKTFCSTDFFIQENRLVKPRKKSHRPLRGSEQWSVRPKAAGYRLQASRFEKQPLRGYFEWNSLIQAAT
jgi:hypothetical protein